MSSRWTQNKSKPPVEPPSDPNDPYVPLAAWKRKHPARGRSRNTTPTENLNVRIPRRVMKAIKRFSKEQDVNVSAWVRALIDASLLKKGYITIEDLKGTAA